jgi:hypothetical protein
VSRAFPSQVVVVIDQEFPQTRQEGQGSIKRPDAPRLRGIVDLVKQIPSELLAVPPEDYLMTPLIIKPDQKLL